MVDLDGGGASHVLAEVQRGDLHQQRVAAGRVMEPVAVACGGVAFGIEYVGEQGGQVPVIGAAVVVVDAELSAEAGVGVKRGVGGVHGVPWLGLIRVVVPLGRSSAVFFMRLFDGCFPGNSCPCDARRNSFRPISKTSSAAKIKRWLMTIRILR